MFNKKRKGDGAPSLICLFAKKINRRKHKNVIGMHRTTQTDSRGGEIMCPDRPGAEDQCLSKSKARDHNAEKRGIGLLVLAESIYATCT